MKTNTKTKKGPKIILPDGWPPLPKNVVSIFGFKLIELEGKKMWQAATELDFRESLSRKGITGRKLNAAVKLKYIRGGCSLSGGQCSGNCPGVLGICASDIDSFGHVVFCYCTNG